MSVAQSRWIAQLKPVDLITLSGLLLAGAALWLAACEQVAFSMAVLYLAMLADAMDGYLARRWQQASEFGRYLDGFADAFIYLMVPAVWLWQWGFHGVLQAAVIATVWIAGVIRLSVFNSQGNTTGRNGQLAYLGMPVFWVNLLLGAVYAVSWAIGAAPVQALLLVLLPGAAVLMVLNRPFFKFNRLATILMITVGGAIVFALAGWLGFSGNRINGAWINAISAALWLTLPIVIGGVLHMVAVTRDWLPWLKVPVHAGWFGANKTWRGFVLMPLFTVPGAYILYALQPWLPASLGALFQHASPLVLGLALGFGYALLELPNSFIKRRLGVAPGETPARGHHAFILADQFDSALGFGLVYFWLAGVGIGHVVLMIALFPLVALLVKRCLYWARLKQHYC